VWVLGIWGEVTTTISAAHTLGHLRLNDQTATIDMTVSAGGLNLSGLAVGTMFYKEGLAAAALSLQDNAVGAFEESATAGVSTMSDFVVTKKTGAVTTIDYVYTTTDAPSTGAILLQAMWIPLSIDGKLSGSDVVSPAQKRGRYK
jgi:hypothetical protein